MKLSIGFININKVIFSLFIILMIENVLCEIKVFPDHYKESDSVFVSDKLDKGVEEKQIYKLGYFSSTSGETIKSYKHALRYNSDTSCNGTKTNNGNIFTDGIDTTSTRQNYQNYYSEEIDLLKHICYGLLFSVDAPFPTLHNTGYILHYKLAMAVSGTKTIKVYKDYSKNQLICEYKLSGKGWLKMTIKSKLTITNEINMIFICDHTELETTFNANIDDNHKFYFYIDGTNNIYVSFYQVILEDTVNSYFSGETDTNLIRTRNGKANCNNDNDCVPGYFCESNKCTKCAYNCFQCQTSFDSCSICNTLTDVKTSSSTCPLNYIDLSQFKDFSRNVPLKYFEFHERSTMGFWIFISELTKAKSGTKNIFHVSLKDRYVISIVPNELSVDLYCHAYEDLYRHITTETTLASNYADKVSDFVISETIPSSTQANHIDRIDLSGQWFHVTCGLSFDHKKYYLKSVMNGEDYSLERTLKKENLYYDASLDKYVENDIFYRHIIRKNEDLKLEFRNFGGSGSKIYLKYFLLFQEYIPPRYKFMYYDLSSVNNQAILYRIPFDNFVIDSTLNKYETKSIKYNLDEEKIELEKNINSEVNLFPPLNFKPLKLLGENTYYEEITCNMDKTKTLTKTGTETTLWDDNKPLFCEKFLKTDVDLDKCSDDCDMKGFSYMIYPWIDYTKGYCDYRCTPDMVCDADNISPGADLEPNNEVFCKGDKVYNLFYSCENEETTYYLQYSSFYNPESFGIGFDLKSYIIELWYYPDFFLTDSNRKGKFTYPEGVKNYVFYTNIGQAFFANSDHKTLRVEDSHHTHIAENYHPYEWNKLVFQGLFKDGKYYKNFYINNLIDDPIYFGYIKEGEYGPVGLSSISFFTSIIEYGDDGKPLYYHRWATGYYKNLRVWNGDTASFPLSVQYDNFYSNGNGRVESIIGYYPLSNQYISNNKIREIIEPSKNHEISPQAEYRYQRYNYGSKFDYIRSEFPFLGHYLQKDVESPKSSQCAIGCLRCWNAGDNCYECSQGYILTLTRQCQPTNSYYFKSPCKDPSLAGKCNANFEIIQKEATTVTFWIKCIGFSKMDTTNEILIIQYSDSIKLYFSKEENGGLILKNNNNVIISKDPDFRERMGKWTFVLLAYHKAQTSGTTYFPRMINFEINADSMKISNERDIAFGTFKILKELYALVFNLRYYHKYIIGGYGFATNVGDMITPFSNPIPEKTYLVPGTSESSCLSDFTESVAQNFGCAADYDVLFDSFPDTYDKYIKYENSYAQPNFCDFKYSNEKTVSNCLNACKGSDIYGCSCLNKNYNSQMIVRGEVDYCRAFDYINFSKAKKITIENVLTAKETKKFTIQFWVFIYNFGTMPNTFNIATLNWYMHNQIKLYYRSGNYRAKCTTWYDKDGKIQEKEGVFGANARKWNYVSCAVSFPSRLFLIYTGDHEQATTDGDDKTPLGSSTPNDFLSVNTKTYFEITDDQTFNEWGYLFYRQIHLWKDFYSNPDFLLRINIKTQSKFPYLLHSWDPLFKGYKDLKFNSNFIVSDICGIANDFEVIYEGELGFNVIKEEEIKHITLCTEDGEYYDSFLKKCLQFSDLSQLEDFTFTGVPFSYSGSYSMAFWIFFEDSSMVSGGMHFRWERHLQISIIQNADLEGYCFPQGYYADNIPNNDLAAKASKLTNSVKTKLSADSLESGVWLFVLCSVSNYKKTYFIKGNGDSQSGEMVAEILYTSDTTGDVLNSYPYHYYMSEVENDLPQKSKLYLENLKTERKVYIRDLFLFKDYIPSWYADAFKHTDLAEIKETKMLQSMVFVCNFADFNLNRMTLDYYVIQETGAGDTSTFTKTKKNVKLTSQSSSSFELSANFQFIPVFPPKEITTPTSSKNFYTSNDNIPIVCKKDNYITLNEYNNNLICSNSCMNNTIRIPGTPSSSGICNIKCDSSTDLNCPSNLNSLKDYQTNYKCSTKIQTDYKCFDNSLIEKSAFFFSRCYNQPNFYTTIDNSNKNLFQNGYYYEFWFKIDKVQTKNYCTTNANKEYFLYSTPHSIYLDLNENKYYYQIIDSVLYRQLDGISEYEWNKIVIKTTLGSTLGQNAYVYVNFDINNIKAEITDIPSSINMQLQYISFCSKNDNGYCTPAGPALIEWGSAYYKNIRIWELYSSTIYSIQDFNIDIYKEIPLSLKLFYPLDINNIDKNKLKQIINIDPSNDILATHRESSNFNSEDDYSFFNYATNFDWYYENDENKKKYISTMEGPLITYQDCGECCERCFTSATTNCYKCTDECVLKAMSCIPKDGYYLKIPLTSSSDEIRLNFDPTGKKALTLTFYMKFEGVIQNPSAPPQKIVILSDTMYLAYNNETSYLQFYIDDELAFQHTKFYNYIGQWIPYSIAIYASDENDIYPHMFTFSVNKEDIPFTTTFSLKSTFTQFSYIHLGKEVIALFADLRIYDTFIQGSFGTAKSTYVPIAIFALMGTTTTNCLTPAQKASGSANPICVKDYTDYIAKSCNEPEKQYFDLSLLKLGTPCDSCSDYCKTKCYNSDSSQCTCDMTDGLYWLRRSKKTKETYCEYLPFIDYSILEDISMVVPSSTTLESTLEFWIFIYSYNTEQYNFNEIILEWDLHNKVDIINNGNSIIATCYAICDLSDASRATKKMTLTISGFQWTMIRCGTDFISNIKKYYLNSQEEEISITLSETERNSQTLFNIRNVNVHSSFGYVFLREIKLWQQYNFKYIDTSYTNLRLLVGTYNITKKKSTGIFPGLISYIRSEFKQDDYLDVKTSPHKYKIINEIGSDEAGSVFPRTYIVNRINDFKGYNIIDPDNYGYYDELTLCNEGFIYDSGNNRCVEANLDVTKCQYPKDINDNCITCPEENIYIHPQTGDCVEDCGVRFFARDEMNQCRDCHTTCYTCFGYKRDNCLSCTDELYLVEDLHICEPFCQPYGLTESIIEPNKCVPFEAKVELVNYKERVPIDINTFNYIIAKVSEINTKYYIVKWEFDPEATKAENKDSTMEFPFETPFDDPSANTGLNASVNNAFWRLKKYYVINVKVISYNVKDESLTVERTFPFTLLTNSYPEEGKIELIPNIGLNNLTVFLIRCLNWTDDTTDKFEYSFYYHENNTSNDILLQDWSSNNELITNFTVENIDLEKNEVEVFCKVRDNYFAESIISENITIVTNLSSGEYSTDKVLNSYHLIEGQVTYVQLYYLSEVLKSFGLNRFINPSFYQSKYRPTEDQSQVVIIDPPIKNELCNSRGTCELVDEFLVCYCDNQYLGTNCHIEKNYSGDLITSYKDLFQKLMETLQADMHYEEFLLVYNLFYSAQFFAPDPSFFKVELNSFLSMTMNGYKYSIYNSTYKYIDLLDFYYSFELERLNKARVEKMGIAGSKNREISIDSSAQDEFKEAFDYIHNTLLSLVDLLTSKYINKQINYTYSSNNFYLEVKSVNPIFEENVFFAKRRANYHTFPRFMTCLNWIETTTLSNPYFQTFMIYIEYLNFPFGYDNSIYSNNTSPLIELKFIDATNGKNFDLVNCEGSQSINIDMPFTNYRSLDIINTQRILFDPRYYKSPSDPIFSDPIYINKSGYVSNDTVEQRIEKYHRKNNFSCRYYDTEKQQFVDDGVVFTNYSSDSNYIQFNTSHLSRFTTFMVPNNATFKISGRFYYLSRPELIKWSGNYSGNFGFIIFIVLVSIYVFFSLVLGFYDSTFSVKETLLESLKKEIIKSFLPYKSKKEKDRIAAKMVPLSLSPKLLGDESFQLQENSRYPEDMMETIADFDKKKTLILSRNSKNETSEERLETKETKVTKSKKKKPGVLSRKAIAEQKRKGEKSKEEQIKQEEDFAKLTYDFYKANFGEMAVEEMDPNKMGEKKEKSDAEYKRKLNMYANLNLSFGQYLGKNLIARNILINPFLNISMFSPRWKKLVPFITEINIETLMITIFLTNDEKATEQNMSLLIEYSIFSILISDSIIHILAVFFQVSDKQQKLLLKLVLSKGQLIVMKEFEAIICVNGIFTLLGMIICYIIWLISLYICFTFNCVWKVQEKAFLLSTFICIGADFIVLDFVYELFLAIIYLGRQNSSFLRRIGEFLNRIRNYRCMAN